MRLDHSPRAAAAHTLDRVLRSGAYSNVLVAATHITPPESHGSYQSLVFATLRHLPGIDATIGAHATRPLSSIEPLVLALLRTAVCDLVVHRTPPYAAVDGAVDAVRELGRPRAAGFVNGVLRAVGRAGPYEPTIEGSYPDTTIEIVERGLSDEARTFLTAANQPALPGVRVRKEGISIDGFTTSIVGGAGYVDGTSTLADLVDDGTIDVIDPASSAVAAAVDARPGEHVLDLAAAPGGKTLALADAVGPDGIVVAADVHARRVRTAAQRAPADAPMRWVVADGTRTAFRPERFDRVLLDAPCSGLGTLRRRPEIRFRVDDDAVVRLARLQSSLLRSAMALVRPGGRLVYSVCTVTREETVDAVDGLGFRPPSDITAPRHGDGVLLAPHSTGTDGMFIAVWDA